MEFAALCKLFRKAIVHFKKNYINYMNCLILKFALTQV